MNQILLNNLKIESQNDKGDAFPFLISLASQLLTAEDMNLSLAVKQHISNRSANCYPKYSHLQNMPFFFEPNDFFSKNHIDPGLLEPPLPGSHPGDTLYFLMRIKHAPRKSPDALQLAWRLREQIAFEQADFVDDVSVLPSGPGHTFHQLNLLWTNLESVNRDRDRQRLVANRKVGALC